jgi:hypothetical protein
MYMKKIVCSALCVLTLVACNNAQREKELAATNDSLAVALDEKTKALDQAMQAIADIQEGFRVINAAEGRMAIHAGVEGVTDTQLLKEDICFIQQRMEANREQIERLQKKLKANDIELDGLRKVLTNLQRELDDKVARIAALQAELLEKNIRIAELDSAVIMLTSDVNTLHKMADQQQELIEQQVLQLNAAWYVYGTAKELKDQNILKSGKVFSSTDFNKNYFTEIDVRDDKVFPLYAKHAKLLTTHPEGSYELSSDEDKQLTLSIVDVDAFWSVSRYLVIQTR